MSLCYECERKRLEKRKQDRDYHHEYVKRSQTEDKKYRKFYGSKEWQMTSKQYALDHKHTCEECGGIGTDVHHVIPIQTPEGWKRRFDMTNLRLLCVSCHNRAHGRIFGSEKR